jgi:hypothetical protein
VVDAVSKDRPLLYLDALYLAQELVMRLYFDEDDPPLLQDVGHAQDLILEVER